MNFVLSSNTAWSVLNFRQELIMSLLDAGHQVFVLAPDDAYAERLKEMGCAFLPLRMDNKGRNPWTDFLLWLQYCRYYREIRPDFVINYTIKPVIYSSLACRRLGMVYMNVITGLGMAFSSENLVHRLICFLYRRANASAQKVFFLNADDHQVFINKRLVSRAKAMVIPGEGVDCQRFSPLDKKEPTKDEVRFLFLGRILREKGVELLYRAFVRLRQQFPQARLTFMGFLDAPSDSAVGESEMSRWCEQEGVEYWPAQEDVRSAIGQSDCIVLPSFYNEGVPRSLLEAGAMAKILITSNQVGCRDVVKHGVNGFICQAKSEDSLLEQMEAVMNLSWLEREQMQDNGRVFITENFSMVRVLPLYWNEFSGLPNFCLENAN